MRVGKEHSVAEPRSRNPFERLEHALAAGGVGAWEVLLPDRRAWFSAGLRALLGADEATLPDSFEAFESRIHPEDLDRVRHAIERQVNEPGRLDVEFRARSRDGRFAWFEAIGEGRRDGGAVHVRGVLRSADLRREPGRDGASTARASFLAAMSHEIRTPMTAILGFADLIGEHGGVDAGTRTAAESIRRNGEHLLKIVNDILDLSRIEAGAMTMEEIAVAPIEIVEEVVSSLRPRVRSDAVELVVELLSPVPALIRTDPTRLRQILFNLIDNAIKFTERGSVRIGLERGPGESLRIHVTDTGIGIESAQIDRVFRPFAQAEVSTARRFGGTGLGLDISRRLARMLGGELSVRSTPGRGSTFSLEVSTGPLAGIPLIASVPSSRGSSDAGAEFGGSGGAGGSTRLDATKDAMPRADRGAGAASGERHGASSIRVLLAEDGADTQRLIKHHLERDGMSVAIATNGRSAVELALTARRRGEPFDVILMDLELPEMDGVQATSSLRDGGYTGAIIALTAHADGTARERFHAVGVDAILPKPIDRARLIDAIRQSVVAR